MKNILINFSNHPSFFWGKKQLEVAKKYGPIVDLPFPSVDAHIDKDEIQAMAAYYVDKIKAMDPRTVMVQGEFGLTYQIVNELKKEGIQVIYASSQREVQEVQNEEGETIKKSIFQFIRFREY